MSEETLDGLSEILEESAQEAGKIALTLGSVSSTPFVLRENSAKEKPDSKAGAITGTKEENTVK